MSRTQDIRRRDFLKRAVTTAAAVSLPAVAQTGPGVQQAQEELQAPRWVEIGAPKRLERYIKLGQPIALSGKRLVFTSYDYILPGAPAWYDDLGENASVTGTADLWAARLKTSDAPTGIQIGVEPATHSPKPFEMESTRPWERGGVSLCDLQFDANLQIHWAGNILFDEEDGYIKAWGTCAADGTSYRCYFQSKDLQTWERPELGLIEFAGNKKNNLIQLTDGALFGNVFKDPSSREERWKWMLEGETTIEQLQQYRKRRPHDYDPRAMRLHVKGKQTAGYHILAVRGGVSPDGFRWTTIPEPLVVEHSDTLHSGYYDAALERYVAYFRQYAMPRYSPQSPVDDHGLSWKVARRSIGRSETEDFRRFPLSETILEPGPEILGPSDTLYTNCHTFVPGTRDQHLFFPTVWHQDRDITSVAAVASRDGRLMHWLPGNPVLKTSPFGEWDGGCLFALPDLIELPGGDWVLPYIGFNVPHKYPRRGAFKYGLGFATWPKGRFAAVQAVGRAQFMTYAFVAPGSRIRLNALTERGAGRILVEVADLSRKIVPGRSFDDCTPIVGDQPAALVTWKNGAEIGRENGAPIMLRFRMDRAKLFSVHFET